VISWLMHVEDPRLTTEQANHIAKLAKEFSMAMAEKYAKGQAEHGGNLWDLSEDQLLQHALEEAIDEVVYLLTIIGKRRATP
jgi:hypothetical protein